MLYIHFWSILIYFCNLSGGASCQITGYTNTFGPSSSTFSCCLVVHVWVLFCVVWWSGVGMLWGLWWDLLFCLHWNIFGVCFVMVCCCRGGLQLKKRRGPRMPTFFVCGPKQTTHACILLLWTQLQKSRGAWSPAFFVWHPGLWGSP